jgi:hypothetical protein
MKKASAVAKLFAGFGVGWFGLAKAKVIKVN